MFLPVSKYFNKLNGKQTIDKIYKLEELDDAIKDIKKQINIDFGNIEKTNKTNNNNPNIYKTYYNNYTKNLVYKYYKDDIETFNYSF